MHRSQIGSLAPVPGAVSCARLTLLGSCASFPVAAEWTAPAGALAAASWEARHSCSSVTVDAAVLETAAAMEAGEVANIGRAAVGASACPARMASVALEGGQAVPERVAAKRTDRVCREQSAGTLRAVEALAVGLVAKTHCAVVGAEAVTVAAVIAREAPSQRRLEERPGS